MLDVVFGRRDFSGRLGLPGLRCAVERLTWRAVGGPERAELRVDGDESRLLALAGLLRCPVWVGDATAGAWWGMVSAVELHVGGQVVRFSLDEMANRAAARYTPLTPQVNEPPLTTAFVEDADSVRQYGVKEQIFQMSGTHTAAAAAAYAQAMVRKAGKPLVSARLTQRDAGGGAYARIEARGWWSTLDWRYYAQPAGLGGQDKTGLDQPVGTPQSAKVTWWLGDMGGLLSEVWVRARAFRAADNLKFDLYGDDPRVAQPPPPAASLSLAGTSLSAGHTWLRWLLPQPLAYPGSVWWGMLSRSGALTDLNYFGVQVDETLADPTSLMRVLSGATWAPRVPDADLIYRTVGLEESTAQLARVLAAGAAGQFLTELRIERDSGLYTALHRAGSERGRVEAERILELGAASGRRLLVKVDAARRARVYNQPLANEPAAAVGRDGVLRSLDGRALPACRQPAGEWVKLVETPVGLTPGNWGTVFAERVEWSAQEGLRLGTD